MKIACALLIAHTTALPVADTKLVRTMGFPMQPESNVTANQGIAIGLNFECASHLQCGKEVYDFTEVPHSAGGGYKCSGSGKIGMYGYGAMLNSMKECAMYCGYTADGSCTSYVWQPEASGTSGRCYLYTCKPEELTCQTSTFSDGHDNPLERHMCFMTNVLDYDRDAATLKDCSATPVPVPAPAPAPAPAPVPAPVPVPVPEETCTNAKAVTQRKYNQITGSHGTVWCSNVRTNNKQHRLYCLGKGNNLWTKTKVARFRDEVCPVDCTRCNDDFSSDACKKTRGC